MTRWKSPINLLGNPGDITNVMQIVQDWRTQPFVSLTVSDDVCPDGSEPVFSKTWAGTEPGCAYFDFDRCGDNCEIQPGEGFAENMYDREARVKYNDTHPNPGHSGYSEFNKKRTAAVFCRDRNKIDPVPAVEMTRINGKVICGTRGGNSFEQVVRPDLDSDSCPEGTSKCSELTSAENSVCYPIE